MTSPAEPEWEYEYMVDDSPEAPGVGPVLRRPVAYGQWRTTGTRAEARGDDISRLLDSVSVVHCERHGTVSAGFCSPCELDPR